MFGLRSNKSTGGKAIFHFLKNLCSKLNLKETSAAVFCDMSKAFDCVHHKILSRRMRHYGFRGQTFNWLEDFGFMRHGIPQDFILGPLLFLLHFNDLVNLKMDRAFTVFTDNTTILRHDTSLNNLHRKMVQNVSDVSECTKLCQ